MMETEEILPCPFCGRPYDPDPCDGSIQRRPMKWIEFEGDHLRHYYFPAHEKDVEHVEHLKKAKGYEITGQGDVWEVLCLVHNGGCSAQVSGDSREEAIANWNRRKGPCNEKQK